MGDVGDNIGFIMIPNAIGNVKTQVLSLVSASLLFVCGLSWNDFFNSLLIHYVPKKYREAYSGWIKLAYALTLAVVIIIVISLITYYAPNKK